MGKQGVTPEVISEVVSQLEVKDMIKVKWLKNAVMDPGMIIRNTNALVIAIRGRTMVIARRRG